jgi:hypothetical protein
LYVSAHRFDEIADKVLAGRHSALIKIDVEGGELSVLEGMTDTLRRERAWVLCEVLHRHHTADAQAHRKHLEALAVLVQSLDYAVYRIEKNDHKDLPRGFTRLSGFPDMVYDNNENGHLCDFIFMPNERDINILSVA